MDEGDDPRGGSAAKPLFVTRRATRQVIVWRILGVGVPVVGVVAGFVDVFSGKPDGWTSLGFFVFFFGGFGALCLWFAAALAGSRVSGYDDHLEVRVGLGRVRRVGVDEIATLRYGTQSNQGGMTFTSLVARDERRKKLFQVFTGFRDFGELEAWLERRRPEQLAECRELGVG